MILRKNLTKINRKRRIRHRISGTVECPRLSVYRSLGFIYAQIIDDNSGKTLVSASDIKNTKAKSKIESAKVVGKEIAKKALEKKIEKIVFDRNGYKYHGRIKALAESAREGGLKF